MMIENVSQMFAKANHEKMSEKILYFDPEHQSVLRQMDHRDSPILGDGRRTSG